MKHLQLIGLSACAAFFTSCESTDMANNPNGGGNQESKRLAAMQQERQQSEETDEAQRNLWNAQHDILTRDGNAAPYY